MCSYFPRGPLALARCCCCCWRDANSDAEAPDDPLKPTMQCETSFPCAESRTITSIPAKVMPGNALWSCWCRWRSSSCCCCCCCCCCRWYCCCDDCDADESGDVMHDTLQRVSLLTQTKISVRPFGKIGILCYAVCSFVHPVSILKVLCQFQSK